ncbi:hypothetical protein ACTFIY_006768 [Dictyostelium cf. discoideum]
MKKKILLHTQVELDELKQYMISGDPYRNLNLNKNETIKDPRLIEKSYKVLVRKHKIAMSEKRKQDTKPNKDELEREKQHFKKLTNSYKLLSNRRMKELYDHYYYEEMVREYEKNGGNSSFLKSLSSTSAPTSTSTTTTSTLTPTPTTSTSTSQTSRSHTLLLLLKDLSHLFMNITYYPIREYCYIIQSSVNINGGFDENVFNFKELPKYGLGKLYRGILLSSIGLNQLDAIRSIILGKVAGGLLRLKPHSLIGRILRFASKCAVLIPFCLVVDVYVLAPAEYSLIKVVRDCILKRGVGDGGGIKFSNLYYSFLPTLSILVFKKLIRGSFGFLKERISKNYENNKESKKLAILNSLFSNVGLLSSFLCCPLQVIYIQYPKLIINSYLENNISSIPSPTLNPISTAIEIYKNNNNSLSKFFCGLAPYVLSNVYLHYITSTATITANTNNKKSTYDYFDIFS